MGTQARSDPVDEALRASSRKKLDDVELVRDPEMRRLLVHTAAGVDCVA